MAYMEARATSRGSSCHREEVEVAQRIRLTTLRSSAIMLS